MPIDLKTLARAIRPEKTSILLGAGSSKPSGAPSGAELAAALCKEFNLDFDPSLSLSEVATLVEINRDRKSLAKFVSNTFKELRPTAGLLNLPSFQWANVFTTNFDDLIEQAYKRGGKALDVFSSNFDFNEDHQPASQSLFKIHGTMLQDRGLGHASSMVLTTADYDSAQAFREIVFDHLLRETSRTDVLIIGHSLADHDLNIVLEEAIRRKRVSGASGKLYALSYTKDVNRATLLEARGFSIAFGGIDDFLVELQATAPALQLVFADNGDLLDHAPVLRPVTIDVRHSMDHQKPDVLRLFSGGDATYGDIASELTFARDVVQHAETQLTSTDKLVAYFLGAAGLGKTSAARQLLASLHQRGFSCWEHKLDHVLDSESWIKIAKHCEVNNVDAALFVDEAHLHLRALDRIVDHLHANKCTRLRLVLASTPGQWNPRAKSPSLFRIGVEHPLKRLSRAEIDSLLDLFDRKKEVATLVEASFSGFARNEKLRRLQERCRADTFVCMKNIFAIDKLDDIILRDFAALDADLQEIYRTIAAMEASNIRVHRQLVIRVVGIHADSVEGVLNRLTGTISEQDIDVREGIYVWRGRHRVISDLILHYKFHEQDELFALYERVIENINPSYELERFTINELCDPQLGIGRINDVQRQNHLYRKMISAAPAQRPPRHRLIRNLIQSGEFDAAGNEIRIFEKELRRDAPILRYKAQLRVERAKKVSGILPVDRAAILSEAIGIVSSALDTFGGDRALHKLHGEIGLDILRLNGKWDAFDAAMARLQAACDEYLDPELVRVFANLKTRAASLGG